MAEHDDDDQGTEQDNDSALVRDLRKQLKEANKQIKELAPLRTESVIRDLGLDPKSKQAQRLLRLHGDGELTAEALRSTAEDFDEQLPDPTAEASQEVDAATQERVDTVQRIDSLRDTAQPVGSQKMSYSDYQSLNRTNPAEAAKVLASGQVSDLPPFIAETLTANRAERAQTLGA